MRFGSTLAALLLLAGTASATGINTDAALPVGEDVFVSRTQARRLDVEDDIDRYLARQTFAYGVSGDLTLFGSLGYVWNRPGTNGVTDLALFGRYRFFSRDAHRKTLAFSAILGAELPTGKEPFGGQSAGVIAGLVGTWADRDWQVDTNVVESFRFDAPDRTRGDMAVSYAVLASREFQFVAVLEANYRRQGDDHLLYVSPGLQLQRRNVILEASFQILVAEDASRPAARHVAVLGVRLVF